MSGNEAIICVDDEVLILLSMKAELKSHFGSHFLYRTALNAEEALDVVEELSDEGVTVILVISDWIMPGMKGDEFLALMKENHPGIKTILITGNMDKETLERLSANGVANYILHKPWSNEELIADVSMCVN